MRRLQGRVQNEKKLEEACLLSTYMWNGNYLQRQILLIYKFSNVMFALMDSNQGAAGNTPHKLSYEEDKPESLQNYFFISDKVLVWFFLIENLAMWRLQGRVQHEKKKQIEEACLL